MKNILLLKLIKNFRKGEMEAFTAIYNTFKDLIKFYSYKINDEDAFQELNVFLLELVYSIDVEKFTADCTDNIHRYIAVCIRNKYIALSKEKQSYEQMYNILNENDSFCENSPYDYSFVKECLEFLPPKQRAIILYRYVYGYSDNEIAIKLNISRQAVFKLRNRALLTLRKLYI